VQDNDGRMMTTAIKCLVDDSDMI